MALEQEFVAFRFDVVLDLDEPRPGLTGPLVDAAFAECDGLERTMQPKTLEVGGVNDRQVHLIGPITSSQLTLRRGMTSNLQLWEWFTQGTRPGSVLTAHGHVTVRDAAGEPGIEFDLAGCLPVRLRAPALSARGDAVAIEELALVYAHLSVGTPGAGLGFTAGFSAGVSVGVSGSASVGVGAGFSAGFSAGTSGGVGS